MMIEIGKSGVIFCSTRQGVGVDLQFLARSTTPIMLFDDYGDTMLCGLEGVHIRLPFFEVSLGILYEEDNG